MASPANNKSLLDLARALFRSYGQMHNFERCASNCRVVHASEGRIKVELDLREEHTNFHGTLHGGLTATLVDIVTSTAICTSAKRTDGISVDMTVSYLAPAKIGDTILVDGFVNKLGANMCFTGADIFRQSDGVKIATALHTCTYPRIRSPLIEKFQTENSK